MNPASLSEHGMAAVVPVREGMLPAGADETVAECGGNVLLIGSDTGRAADELRVSVARVRVAEVGGYAPAAWAGGLAPLLADCQVIVLPASADGRDLAPRLAAAMGRPLWAGTISVRRAAGELAAADAPGREPVRVALARHDGRTLVEADVAGPAVATLLPGVAGVAPRPGDAAPPDPEPVELALPPVADAEMIELTPPTPATIDLAEAPVVFAGGAGLGGAEGFELLAEVAERAGAAPGATRVAVDAGWAPAGRQIGTTGVTLDPRLYVAFGISGAVQHVAGIGTPEHVICVNTDPSCPMMAMADLAVLADAPRVLRELARLFGAAVRGENHD